MVTGLLDQLSKNALHITRVIITYNTAYEKKHNDNCYPFEIKHIENKQPLGFGANHNQAFQYCETTHFCVMNPDIYLESDPFELLLFCLDDPTVSIVAPSIFNLAGGREDSARYFPTLFGLLRKLFSNYDGVYPYEEGTKKFFPDWVGGMYMLIPSGKYRELAGFDESFFLYYEDVDLCARAWKAGYKVVLCMDASVIHDARRSSRKNLIFFKWHLFSASRFFIKHWGRYPKKIY